MSQQHGLGRGLSSLIPTGKPLYRRNDSKLSSVIGNDETVLAKKLLNGEIVEEVSIDLIVPNPHQPRRSFDEEKLRELTESIKLHGILQPIIVTKTASGYELVAGERRLRAAKMAGVRKMPVIVRDYEEGDKLELAIIENIQRHDLNPMEQARAYKALADTFQLSQEMIAVKMGKSRSAVANTMRLLALPVEIQKAVEEQKISEGHAKAILSIPNPEKQRALYDLILKSKLTVRQAESKAKLESTVVRSYNRSSAYANEFREMEQKLTEVLGTRVQIKKQGGGMRVSIDCYSSEDLVRLMRRIK